MALQEVTDQLDLTENSKPFAKFRSKPQADLFTNMFLKTQDISGANDFYCEGT